MPEQDIGRLIGNLEGGLKGIHDKVDIVLAAQVRIEADHKASIERLDKEHSDSRQRIYERIERERGANDQAFRTFNDTLSRLNEHMVRFSQAADEVELQGQAFLDLEKQYGDLENRVKVIPDIQADHKGLDGRVKALETAGQLRGQAIRQNKIWIRGFIGAATVLESVHLGGGKVLKWLEQFTK